MTNFWLESGYALYKGEVTNTRFVRHQGATLVRSLSGGFDVDFGDHVLRDVPFLFLPPLVMHKFLGKGHTHVFLMLDPDHELAVSLARGGERDRAPGAALLSWLDETFASTASQPPPQLGQNIPELLPEPAPSRGGSPTPAVDPRVAIAAEYVRRNISGKISLGELSRTVHLSPSRFAHLFSEQIGMPVRKYVLWQRMKRAIAAALSGDDLSRAAREGGFADAAHFSRTVSAMFGVPPSAIIRGNAAD
jgi:AraC-like DNA-binding protein